MVTYGKGPVLRSHPHPYLKGSGSQLCPFSMCPSIYANTLCRRTIMFDVITHVGEGRVSWDQPRLPSKESRVPALSNFRGSVFYTHTLTQNDKIRHVSTYWDAQCFRRSATSLCLHKCVARFVSDS